MINVIGLGYIGLPTALILAAHGQEVVGTDYNPKVVESLQKGQVTFEETGLMELFEEAVKGGIRFSKEYQKADYYIVAVPTPYDKKSKKVDSSYVVQAVRSILNVCEKGATIIIESTISPGTIDRSIRPELIKRRFTADAVHLAHAPERIIPGSMVYELKHNSRTIGADDPAVGNQVKEIYQSFCKGEIVLTDIKSAEMTKVIENTYRDINIAFANELAKICRSADMDVYEIIRIANKHPRVNILSPGPGVGGHCISVDPWFLVGDYPELAHLIHEARVINDSMPEYVLGRICGMMEQYHIRGTDRIGLYGLTYKEDVDDVRESPTLQLLECMKRHLGGGLWVYDPYIKEDMTEHQCHDLDSFLNRVDMVVIMVAHKEIRENMCKLADKVVYDTRNIAAGLEQYEKL